MANDPQEKKIIVDEDWKTQAQTEKENLQRKMEEKQMQPEGAGELPPASLELLATTLAMQAMVSLGLIPNPITQKAEVQLDQAKHFIDTLQMLYEKTQGNRTEEETAALDNFLLELRMAYVAVAERGGKG